MNEIKRMTAIVVVQKNKPEFKKYHNISREPVKFARFKNFVIGKFPNAKYINLYDPENKEFLRREVL